MTGSGLAAKLGLVGPARFLRSLPGAAQDLFFMTFHPSRRGAGWLVRKERQYAPRVELLPAVLSRFDDRPGREIDLGGNKMSYRRNGYAAVYARAFKSLPEVRVACELGVFRGSSLALLADRFPAADIAGLDLDFERFESNLPTLRSRGAFTGAIPTLIQFDAFAPDSAPIERWLAGRSIDLFIDDGPHDDAAILRTADVLVPLMSARFLYVVEDNSTIFLHLQRQFPNLRVESHGRVTLMRSRR